MSRIEITSKQPSGLQVCHEEGKYILKKEAHELNTEMVIKEQGGREHKERNQGKQVRKMKQRHN